MHCAIEPSDGRSIQVTLFQRDTKADAVVGSEEFLPRSDGAHCLGLSTDLLERRRCSHCDFVETLHVLGAFRLGHGIGCRGLCGLTTARAKLSSDWSATSRSRELLGATNDHGQTNTETEQQSRDAKGVR
jgi:hypothetical protein